MSCRFRTIKRFASLDPAGCPDGLVGPEKEQDEQAPKGPICPPVVQRWEPDA